MTRKQNEVGDGSLFRYPASATRALMKKGTLPAPRVMQNHIPVYKADARKFSNLLEKHAPSSFYRFDGIKKHKKTYRVGLFVLRGRHGGFNPNKMLQIEPFGLMW